MPKFSDFKSSKFIDLQGCLIEALNAENNTDTDGNIVPNRRVETIYLRKSKAKSMKSEFFEAFPNLRILDLADTKITDIRMFDDGFFEKYPDIKEICLLGCEIADFPKIDNEKNKRKLIGVNWRD